MTLAVLRARLSRSHAEFHAALAGVDDATLEREPIAGDWSARDIAAHLADWNAEILIAAEHLLGGPKPAHHPIVSDQAFNEAHAALHRADSWQATGRRLDATVARAIELSSRFADRLEEPTEHPWNNRGTIRDLFHGVCGHQEEHHDAIRAWRDARG